MKIDGGNGSHDGPHARLVRVVVEMVLHAPDVVRGNGSWDHAGPGNGWEGLPAGGESENAVWPKEMVATMVGDIELFEAIVMDGKFPGAVHAPLFRVDRGPLRNVCGGHVEYGTVLSLVPMSEWRQAQIMPDARKAAGL